MTLIKVRAISHPWGKRGLGVPCVQKYVALDKMKGKTSHQGLGEHGAKDEAS